MNDGPNAGVRIDRDRVNEPGGGEPDSFGPGYARTWRRLWLWPSMLPRRQQSDSTDMAFSTTLEAIIRNGAERDRAYHSRMERADLVASRAREVAGDALTMAIGSGRALSDIVTALKRHGDVLERLVSLHTRGGLMYPPLDPIKQARFEAEWEVALADAHSRADVAPADDQHVPSASDEQHSMTERMAQLRATLSLPSDVMALPIPSAVREAITAAQAILETLGPLDVLELSPEQALAKADADS